MPWPSEFELEVRRELARLVTHQRRTDALVMQLQLECRIASKAVEQKVDELLALLKRERGRGR